MKPCDGCHPPKRATRSIRIETYSGSGRAIERNVCEACYAALGHPEMLAYICQKCDSESNDLEVCESCREMAS